MVKCAIQGKRAWEATAWKTKYAIGLLWQHCKMDGRKQENNIEDSRDRATYSWRKLMRGAALAADRLL